MSEPGIVRLVRCPKCRNVLPELQDCPVYQCGGCGCILQARQNVARVDMLSDNLDEESVGGVLEKFPKAAESSEYVKQPIMRNSGYESGDDAMSIVTSTSRLESNEIIADRAKKNRNSSMTKEDNTVVKINGEMNENTDDMSESMVSTISQTASSSASGSTLSLWDVFLSFHGPDTGYKFTSHLYAALDRQGVRTYPELRSGEVLSDAMFQAIRKSKTYIVVLSQNYVSSKWCLDELVEINNCSESLERSVIVVFYNIYPRVVRRLTRNFKKFIGEHETGFKGEMEKVKKWCVVLNKVANMGYYVPENRYQADIINKVVDRILLKIDPTILDLPKYPVGLHSRVEDITALFSSGTEGVIKIGIHGMGGVGKTTLAKAVYNHNYHRFQGSCFLASIREASGTETGLKCLQQQLISDVLKYKNINLDNIDQGIELIRARICSIKVLIVIDDLDDPKPLKFLVGPFASGSIILITTRNEDVLDSIKVEARYKVNELGDAESHQLFSQHAFGDNIMSDTLKEMSKEILECAGGLPLALTVYGSKLLNKSEVVWRLFIDEMKQFSITEVEKKLLISFEALELVDPMLQDIFLDIVCFFIGWKKKEVVKTMETYYIFVNHYIDILEKRCLLTINNKDELEMHVLLRDMGRKIARNNSPYEPGKRSRLWVSRIYVTCCNNTREQKLLKVSSLANLTTMMNLREYHSLRQHSKG